VNVLISSGISSIELSYSEMRSSELTSTELSSSELSSSELSRSELSSSELSTVGQNGQKAAKIKIILISLLFGPNTIIYTILLLSTH